MASEEAGDWRENKSLLQRQRFMLEGIYAYDVTFSVGSGKLEKIRAHRFILVCGSTVFESLISQQQGTEDDPITLADVDPSLFRELLRYLYYEANIVTPDNASSLLKLSKRFKISQLSKQCINVLQSTMATDSICSLLNIAIETGEPSLANLCVDFITWHAEVILQSEEFTNLTRDSLREVVKSDYLGKVSELQVFEACEKWSDFQCKKKGLDVTAANMREQLDDILFLIRFPCMTNHEFAQATKNSNLLSANERLEIFECIADPLTSLEGSFPSKFRWIPEEKNDKPSNAKGYAKHAWDKFDNSEKSDSSKSPKTISSFPDVKEKQKDLQLSKESAMDTLALLNLDFDNGPKTESKEKYVDKKHLQNDRQAGSNEHKGHRETANMKKHSRAKKQSTVARNVECPDQHEKFQFPRKFEPFDDKCIMQDASFDHFSDLCPEASENKLDCSSEMDKKPQKATAIKSKNKKPILKLKGFGVATSPRKDNPDVLIKHLKKKFRSTMPRIPSANATGEEVVISRFKSMIRSASSRVGNHAISFNCSKPILLCGVGLYQCPSLRRDCAVTLYKGKKDVYLADTENVCIYANGREGTICARFLGGVRLEERTLYTMTTYCPNGCFHGTDGLNFVADPVSGVSFQFVALKDVVYNSSVSSGQFPFLVFKTADD